MCVVQLAKQQLETALRSAQRESMLITDSDLAEVHYKLGRICWTMGGNQLTDPTQARAHFVAATQHDSEVQVCSPHAVCDCFSLLTVSVYTPSAAATQLRPVAGV